MNIQESMQQTAEPTFEGVAVFTGKKDVYDSGAEREAVEGRGRPELLSPFAIIEAAQIAEFGSVKYSDRNWEKGMRRYVQCLVSQQDGFQRQFYSFRCVRLEMIR